VHTEGVFFTSIFEKFQGHFGCMSITAMLTASVFLVDGVGKRGCRKKHQGRGFPASAGQVSAPFNQSLLLSSPFTE